MNDRCAISGPNLRTQRWIVDASTAMPRSVTGLGHHGTTPQNGAQDHIAWKPGMFEGIGLHDGASETDQASQAERHIALMRQTPGESVEYDETIILMGSRSQIAAGRVNTIGNIVNIHILIQARTQTEN